MSTGRKNVMLGTAGHVDHGKTALVKLLTGCNTDRLAEEQRRGLTIDLGFAPCRMWDERIVGVVDVPGHVDFIRNMVAGAHGIDVVIFVVAANDGVMPQTREHLDILTLMGVRYGIIALTKIDMVDAEIRELAADEVRGFVTGTFLEGAPICPMSNITGEGFEDFYRALNAAVDACHERESAGLFRVWVSDVFSIRGFGAVVTGIPSGGTLHVGNHLRLLPGDAVGRVRHLEVYGEEATEGRAGECVALNVVDIPPDDLRRGTLLCAGDAFQPVSMVEAELHLLPFVTRPLKDYLEVHVHVGTAEVMAHVAVLDERELQPGRNHLVQLRLREPLGLAPGDRFVIRAAAAGLAAGRVTTLGGGRILGVSNIRLRRGRSWTLEALAARQATIDDPAAWCATILREAAGPLTAPALATRTLLPQAQVTALLADLQQAGTVLAAGTAGVVHRETVEQAARHIIAVLDAFHQENPLALGLGESGIAERVLVHQATFHLALRQLLAAKTVETRGAVIALTGHAVNLNSGDQVCLSRLEDAFRQGLLTPPDPAELATTLNMKPGNAQRLIGLLIDQGTLIRVAPDLVMHREAVARGIKVALALFAKAGGFTTMEFRDALGVSRKYAVPLLDHLDTLRYTARSGNRRTPGVEAKKALAEG
ncbi:MAG TPA: selenocysteine-specific translation elongation factor [Armatimonadota bacterium]|jgi:selenocysteine-specific elongation factor